MVSQGKEFPETCTVMRGFVVNFTDDVKVRGLPSVLPNIPSPLVPPWKSPTCAQQGQAKSQCPEFLLHIKVQSSQDLANLACVSSFSPLLCCGVQAPSCVRTAMATWLLRPCGYGEGHESTQYECRSHFIYERYTFQFLLLFI